MLQEVVTVPVRRREVPLRPTWKQPAYRGASTPCTAAGGGRWRRAA